MARFKFLEWESTPTTYYVNSIPNRLPIVDAAFERLTSAFFAAQSLFIYMFWSPFLFTGDVFWLAIAGYRSIHWLYQIIILTYAYVWIAKNYQNYLNLGKGGTPPTFAGFLRVTRLRAIGGLWSVFHPPETPPLMHPYRGKLDADKLAQRDGARPLVGGVAPQRQLDQKTPPSTFRTLLDVFERKINEYSQEKVIEMRPSFLEGATTALFAVPSQWTYNRPTIHEFGYEISHPHRNDGSLHMVLHPEDCTTIIEKGWGERHPLARGSWYWRTWHWALRRVRTDQRPTRPPVPEYLCFIYAPRNEEELEVIERLLDAAIWFATGFDYDTGARIEDVPEREWLPAPPPLQENQIRWADMTDDEKWESSKLNWFSEKFDNFLGFVWKWIIIRFGSVAFVIWIMELHTPFVQWFVYVYWGLILYTYRFQKFL
jgi:hypothetical protein